MFGNLGRSFLVRFFVAEEGAALCGAVLFMREFVVEWKAMQKKEEGEFMEGKGTLYLCATPIGNLEDMTYRAVRVLGEVALIAAEDTRHTRKLLTHFDIHAPLVSYHEHNKLEQGPKLVERLLAGDSVAVVSDAGLPGIADPGAHLVQLAIEAGCVVIPLPGANAALSALICSGLDTTAFVFVGFLPKTAKKRRALLDELALERRTMLFYESPHRFQETLRQCGAVFGATRQAVAARELTKKFEQFVRGDLATLEKHFATTPPRGEFCLVIAGNAAEVVQPHAELSASPAELVVRLMEGEALDKKEAIREVARRLQIAKRDVYRAVVEAEAAGEIKEEV